MQQTSLLAYASLDDLTARQAEVYHWLLNHGPANNLQIAGGLQMPINSITGRTKELVDKGKVRQAFKDVSTETGKLVIFWEVAPM